MINNPGIDTSFGPVRQIDAGVLNVGYVEAGPPNGRPVVLLHGWPCDIHSYMDAVPILVSAGYRVIAPYARDYGSTRFLSKQTVRNGRQAALAAAVVALMDAAAIRKAIIAKYDWGAQSAAIVAALWPERCKALVSVSGNLEANKAPLPPNAGPAWWCQFYFATERGRSGYERYRKDLARLVRQTASPEWNSRVTTFDRSADALDNPDHIDVVIHDRRWRLGLAQPREGRGSTTRKGGWRALPSFTCPPSLSRATRTAGCILSRRRAPNGFRPRMPRSSRACWTTWPRVCRSAAWTIPTRSPGLRCFWPRTIRASSSVPISLRGLQRSRAQEVNRNEGRRL